MCQAETRRSQQHDRKGIRKQESKKQPPSQNDNLYVDSPPHPPLSFIFIFFFL